MFDSTPDTRAYYVRPGPMTVMDGYADLLTDLPTDVPGLVRAVQNVLLHVFWAEQYGVRLTPEQQQEPNLRAVSRTLARVRELDARPLTYERPLDRRVIHNCRNFSTLLTALLRHQGIPARARCGFGVYFFPDGHAGHPLYEDHWVTEYWNAEQGRWVLVDAQMDELQRRVLRLSFDPLDVPRDQFLVGGRAWQMYRNEGVNGNWFGIFDFRNWHFILGNLIRDLASLNKVETLPWDGWGRMLGPDDAEWLAELDHVAAVTLRPDECFDEVRALYADPRFTVPEEAALIDLRQ